MRLALALWMMPLDDLISQGCINTVFLLRVFCVPLQNLLLKPMTVFGDRAFTEVIKLKMRLLGLALIQLNCCPYKKRKYGHTARLQQCTHMCLCM